MLKGEHVYLRTLEPEDTDVLYQWENDPENWKVSHTLVPFSRYQLKQYVESPQDIFAHQQIRFMICSLENDQPLGAIDLFELEVVHQRVGVGILIANNAERGRGYGSEALQLLIDYAFKTLPVRQLFCNILVDNDVSIKLFESAGFKITGTKKNWVRDEDEWKDEHILQLIK